MPLPLILARVILQDFINSIDHDHRTYDYVFTYLVRFSLVCREWRVSLLPQLRFRSIVPVVQEYSGIEKRVRFLASVGLKGYTLYLTNNHFETLMAIDLNNSKNKEKGSSGGGFLGLFGGGKDKSPKVIDQLKPFRDQIRHYILSLYNVPFSNKEITDYINPMALERLDLFGYSKDKFKAGDFLQKYEFSNLKRFSYSHFNPGKFNYDWSFRTMPAIEKVEITDLSLTAEEITKIYSRVKHVRYSCENYSSNYIDPLKGSVVEEFTGIFKWGFLNSLLGDIGKLLNANKTLRSIKMRMGTAHPETNTKSGPDVIQNNTLELLDIKIEGRATWFDKYLYRWGDQSNLKRLILHSGLALNFDGELSIKLLQTFPRLETLYFSEGQIEGLEHYLLGNKNLKMIYFAKDLPLYYPVLSNSFSLKHVELQCIDANDFLQIINLCQLHTLIVANLECPSFSFPLVNAIILNKTLNTLSFHTKSHVFESLNHFTQVLIAITTQNHTLSSLKLNLSIRDFSQQFDPSLLLALRQAISANASLRVLKIKDFHAVDGMPLDPNFTPIQNVLKSQSILFEKKNKK